MTTPKPLAWPDDAAAFLGLSAQTLQQLRKDGDCPRLYAPTPRCLVTTDADVIEWLQGKEVPSDYKCRPAVRRASA
ncbi:hypothetical protein D621_05670 [beta proteobacterium AAP51]|nr:hypothetical protein D621_05670 [beta proteobacterium AAP51]